MCRGGWRGVVLHRFANLTELQGNGVDWYAISLHKLYGPHLGALVGRVPVQEDCKQDKLKEKHQVGQKRKQLQGQKGSTYTFTANRTNTTARCCMQTFYRQHAGASDGQERRICAKKHGHTFNQMLICEICLGQFHLRHAQACSDWRSILWPLEKAVGWRTRGLA